MLVFKTVLIIMIAYEIFQVLSQLFFYERMNFKKRSVTITKFTMDVDPGRKLIEKFGGVVEWHMMDSENVISNISFEFKNENGNLVSLNGQLTILRLSIKDNYFDLNTIN